MSTVHPEAAFDARTSKHQIALISNRADVHTDRLVDELVDANADFFRLNVEDLGERKAELVYAPLQLEGSYVTQIATRRRLDLGSVRSAFVRRVVAPKSTAAVPDAPALDAFFRGETRDLSWELYDLLGENLLCHPLNTIRWPRLAQHRLARRFGFRTPASILTNSVDCARQFLRVHKSCVCKALGDASPVLGGETYRLYTSRIDESIANEVLSAIAVLPTLLMERIEKRRDLRVVVVGENVFPIAIESQTNAEGIDDFRKADLRQTEHSHYPLPDRTRDQIVAFASAFGQPIAHIDFAVTQDDELVFFENNLNGQWLWLEAHTKLPITRVIAALIMQHASR